MRTVDDQEQPGHRWRRLGRTGLRGLGVAVIVVGAAGCLGASGGGSVPAGASVVQIRQMAYRPRIVTVKVGQPVTWRFDDAQVLHDVDAATGAFHSPLKDSGTWTHTFTAPGTYSYFCSVHTYMTGQVIVVPG